MSKVIAVYDVTGIQDYIFNSDKLKENIGASQIVFNIMDSTLPLAINNVIKNDKKIKIDWKNSKSFSILHEDITAEIIYIGGGNAYVAFDSEESFKAVTKEFSKLVFEKTYNLSVVSAFLPTDFKNYAEDMKNLMNKLDTRKSKFNKTSVLQGISINRESKDGMPVFNFNDKNEFISKDTFLKLSSFKNETQFDSYIADLGKDKYEFPKEFEKLGLVENDAHIAVVHIDGNNMGANIKNALDNIHNYEDAVLKMRNLSQDIDKAYKNAFKSTLKIIEQNIPVLKQSSKFKITNNADKTLLPIRPIIINGDDITFVCDARLAFSITPIFLKEIEKQKVPSLGSSFTACAGICIVGSHFPFARAYELAEDCCSSAKSKAKFFALKDNTQILSWMDFHISYSGITGDLNDLRDRHYNISDCGKADITHNGHDLEGYNLLWRPWLVSFDDQPESWSNLIKSLSEMISSNDNKMWPKSKIKELRSVLAAGKTATTEFLSESSSRGRKLPSFGFGKIDNGFIGEKTPFYDLTEIMDLYIPFEITDLDGKKGGV